MQVFHYNARQLHFCIQDPVVYAFAIHHWGKTNLRIFSRYGHHIMVTAQLKSSYLNTVIEKSEIQREWFNTSLTEVLKNWV